MGTALSKRSNFLQHDLNPSATRRIVAEQAAAMMRPTVDIDRLLARLASSGAAGSAKLVSGALVSDECPTQS